MHNKIVFAALIIVLVLVNGAIVGKEIHLAKGRIVYLELRKYDPRSLMQGDYMALDYQMADQVYSALPRKQAYGFSKPEIVASDGYAVVSVDRRGISRFKRLHSGEMLAGNEILIRFRVRNGQIRFATNAFFFQEGDEKYYQRARYGQFSVSWRGELILTGLYDGNLKRMGPDSSALGGGKR